MNRPHRGTYGAEGAARHPPAHPVPGLGLIWAQARGAVIGAGGVMPWHLPEDLAHFRAVTRAGTVIMGRATWLSLPERFRPLPGRRNIVLSRRPDLRLPGAEVARSLSEAADLARPGGSGEDGSGERTEVWVIGGGQVYLEALSWAQRLVVTEIDIEVNGDTYAPAVDDTWQASPADPTKGWYTSAAGLPYRFREYRRAGQGASTGPCPRA